MPSIVLIPVPMGDFLKINKTITAILCFEIWILIMTLLKNGNILPRF